MEPAPISLRVDGGSVHKVLHGFTHSFARPQRFWRDQKGVIFKAGRNETAIEPCFLRLVALPSL
jgi:hypothetical protein